MAQELPVRFEVETRDALLTIRLIAEPKCDLAAEFALELTAGSNRSVHKGEVETTAGAKILLSTVSAVIDGSWRARLTVWPSGQPPYEEVVHSDSLL